MNLIKGFILVDWTITVNDKWFLQEVSECLLGSALSSLRVLLLPNVGDVLMFSKIIIVTFSLLQKATSNPGCCHLSWVFSQSAVSAQHFTSFSACVLICHHPHALFHPTSCFFIQPLFALQIYFTHLHLCTSCIFFNHSLIFIVFRSPPLNLLPSSSITLMHFMFSKSKHLLVDGR